MSASVPSQPAGGNQVSWWDCLANIYSSPKDTFAVIPERPFRWPAFLASAVGILLMSLATVPATSALVDDMFRAGPFPDAARVWAKVAMWVGIGLVPVLVPLVTAFGYAIALFFVGLFLEARAGFGRLFTLSLWAIVPALTLGSVARGIVASLQQRWANFPDPFTLDVLVPGHAPKLFHIIGQTLDLFSIWTCVLLAVGFVVINASSRRAGGIVFACLIALRFLSLALAMRQG